jgi:hypothetical protein
MAQVFVWLLEINFHSFSFFFVFLLSAFPFPFFSCFVSFLHLSVSFYCSVFFLFSLPILSFFVSYFLPFHLFYLSFLLVFVYFSLRTDKLVLPFPTFSRSHLRAARSGFWGSIPAGAGNFSLHHRVQNVSGAHPASYPMGTRGSFPWGKAAGT